ncbi:hypothetical protein BGX24_004822 [Mortierella sp. AD032]|nr:hypothetical protein BGX24_004822 [Mortierella sp. AD032]
MSSRRSNNQGSSSGIGNGGAGHRPSQQRPAAAAASTRTTSSTNHNNNNVTNHNSQQHQQQEQEPTTVPEIENATHIVVEHLRTGTVKTHVFSSKDGKPSLLGHEIPDTTAIANNSFKEVFESGMEDKMIALKSLVKESLDQTTKVSLDKVDSVKLAVIESEHRLSAQFSSSIEQQIKTDVVPKLDLIERLLLANTNTNGYNGNGSKKGSVRSGSTTPQSVHSEGSLEHMDQLSAKLNRGQPGEKTEDEGEVQDAAAAAGEEEEEAADTVTGLQVFEKLTSMEGQLTALYRVVIDGVEPQQDDAQLDPEMAAKVVAMREQLTSMPEPSQPEPATPEKLDELIEIVNKSLRINEMSAVAATDFSVRQEQTRKEEEETWRNSLEEMLAAHQTGLGGLDTQLLTLESAFRNMDAGFKDWTKTHRMSLNVYLKYMYMVFKSTKGVESRIETALDEVRAQSAMEPGRHAELSNDLQALRTEISATLNNLPETVASAIKRSQDPVILEELPGPSDDSIDLQLPMNRSGPVTSAETHIADAPDVPQPDAEPIVESSAEEVLQPDPVMEKLVLIVETLQNGIASLVEKYSELAERVPPPQPPTPPPRDSVVPIDPEAPEPPPREPPTSLDADATLSAPASGGEETAQDSAPPAPAMRAGNPNPGPSPGYLGRSPSVIAAVSAASAEASGSSAEESKTEIVESQETSDDGDAAAAATTVAEGTETTPHPTSAANFLIELESMNRNLTDLLHTVNEGQLYLHQEIQREFMRVIDTIRPQETEEDRMRMREAENRARLEEVEANSRRAVEEERRAVEAEQFRIVEEQRLREASAAAQRAAEERSLALERISMIPNLMASLEAVSHHLEQKANELQGEVRGGFGELQVGTASVEAQIMACLNKVQLIVDGNIQDSSMLNEIKFQVGEIEAHLLEGSIKIGDEALKAQVAEAIKKMEDVIEIVEDSKKINEKSLTVQEELQIQIGEWHQKQDGEIEALGKRHEESWEAWYTKHDDEWQRWRLMHGDSQGHLVNLHIQQDRSFQNFLEDRRAQHEELQGWHKAHDGRLEELEKRCCHCFMPATTITEAVDSNDKSTTNGPLPPRLPTVDCRRGGAGDTDPCSRHVRDLLEEFLQRILPGYNPNGITPAAHLTLRVNAPEPRAPSGAGVGGDPVEQGPTSPGLSYTTRGTSGIIVPEPSIHATATVSDGSLHSTAIPRGEADSYHGAVGEATNGVESTAADIAAATPAEGSTRPSSRSLPNPPGQIPLPQALYDLLLPIFNPDVAASAASAVAESAALATKIKELEDLQERFETIHREAVDNEDRLMITIGEKTREYEELVMERERMEQVSLARQAEWHETAGSYQQELAKVRADLDHARSGYDNARLENTNLYRMGFGLKPIVSELNPAPATESGEESDSVSEHGSSSAQTSSAISTPDLLPHAGFLAEASASLIQALEEFKQHQATLHQENRMLESKRDDLLAEVSKAEQRYFELSTAAAAVSAAASQILEQPQDQARSSSPQEGAEPVDDDRDENYVTEDENGSLRGRSIGTGRSRALSVFSGSSGGAGVGGSGAGARPSGNTGRPSRQQYRRQSAYSRAQSRGRAMEMYHQERVPQLEADVTICKDGVQSKTILSSTTLLTDEQYEQIRSSRSEAGMDPSPESVWSLSFDVRVKMVPSP